MTERQWPAAEHQTKNLLKQDFDPLEACRTRMCSIGREERQPKVRTTAGRALRSTFSSIAGRASAKLIV